MSRTLYCFENHLSDRITNPYTTTEQRTHLYAAAEAMLDFPVRPPQTPDAHSLQLGLTQLPVHLHTGLKNIKKTSFRNFYSWAANVIMQHYEHVNI